MEIKVFTTDWKDKSLLHYKDLYENYMLESAVEDEEGYLIRVQKNFDHLKFFPGLIGFMNRRTIHYIVAVEHDEIIGVIMLTVDGQEMTCWPGFHKTMNYVTVAPAHQGKGVATALINAMFEHCRKNKISHIIQSGYTEEGKSKIMKVFDKVSANYPDVDFCDYHRAH